MRRVVQEGIWSTQLDASTAIPVRNDETDGSAVVAVSCTIELGGEKGADSQVRKEIRSPGLKYGIGDVG